MSIMPQIASNQGWISKNFRGSAPGPRWGGLQRPPNPPAATTRSAPYGRSARITRFACLARFARVSHQPHFFLDPPLMPVTSGWKITILIIQVCRKMTEIYFASAGRKIFCRTLVFSSGGKSGCHLNSMTWTLWVNVILQIVLYFRITAM